MADQPEMGIEAAADALMEKHRKTLDSEAATGADVEGEESVEDEGTEDLDEGTEPDQEDEDSDDSDDEADDDELEDEDSDSDDDSDDDTDEFVFKIKDEESGEEIGVTAEEARLGYLRQKDYTRKTQEVATERKEVNGLKEELTNTKGEFAKVLQQIQMATDEQLSEFAGIDWAQLERDDPYEYDEKARRFDALMRSREQAQQLGKQAQDEYQREYQAKLDEFKQEEFKKLVELDPKFDPEQGGEEYKQSLFKAAEETYGFAPEEVEGILDHRALLVMRDAQKYHELKARLDKGKKKSEKAPKHVKPGAKTSHSQRKTKQKTALRSKMKSSGSMDDALEFLMSSASAKK